MSNKKKTLYTDQKKKKRKLLLIGIIVGAIGLCAGLGGLGYGIYYITNKKPNPVNPTDLALNTANFDMANHDGEIVANQPVTWTKLINGQPLTPENSQYFTFQEDTTTHKLTVQCNSGDYIHDALTLEIIATAKDDTTKTQTITLPVSNTSPTVGDITFTTDAGKDAAHSLQKTNNDNRLTAHVQSEVLIDNGNKTNYSWTFTNDNGSAQFTNESFTPLIGDKYLFDADISLITNNFVNSPDREFSLNVSGIIKSSTVYFDMNIPNQPTASVSIKTGLPALGPNDEVTFQVDTTATNMVGYTWTYSIDGGATWTDQIGTDSKFECTPDSTNQTLKIKYTGTYDAPSSITNFKAGRFTSASSFVESENIAVNKVANNTYRAVNVNNQVSTGDAGVSTLNLTVQTIKLKTLEIGYTTTLEYLYCDANSLTTLDVSNNPALKSLDCYNSSLTTLDVSKNVNLEYLDISGSNLTTLDVSNNPALKSLYCYGNSLEKLYLPVQNISPVFSIFNNPNLTDIYTKRTSGTQTIYSNQAQSSGKNNASYTIHTLDGIGYPSMFSGTTYAVSGVPITYTVDSTPWVPS